jgi:hypothetical protein
MTISSHVFDEPRRLMHRRGIAHRAQRARRAVIDGIGSIGYSRRKPGESS